MLKIILLFVCFEFAFSIDATMEIVKNKSSLPTISIVAATDSNKDNSIDLKLGTLIQKDLQVSSHFNDSPIKVETQFNAIPKFKLLKDTTPSNFRLTFLEA